MFGTQLGLSSVHFEWDTIDDALTKASDYGCDGVEWFAHEFTDAELAEIAKLAPTAGMNVAYHAPYTGEWDLGLTDVPTGTRLLKSAVRSAHKMGAKMLVAHLGRVPDDDLDRAVDNSVAIVGSVVQELERFGVTLALENDTYCHYDNPVAVEPQTFVDFFDQLRSDSVAMALDVGHSHVTGNTEEFIEVCGDEIVYLHIADNDGTDDQHLGPSDGNIDWEDVFSRLGGCGFSGGLAIEFNEINLSPALPMFR
ncbi:MAG: sugar phosphate isomerase/epimerase family protein, partial [Candidatus Latescibacteria bacterium]|nr:sugar phosphate isomerase/epimerase family protein [Candidatus Latescibacterota bacterium]